MPFGAGKEVPCEITLNARPTAGVAGGDLGDGSRTRADCSGWLCRVTGCALGLPSDGDRGLDLLGAGQRRRGAARVDAAKDINAADAHTTSGGRDVTWRFRRSQKGEAGSGLVTGLTIGRNRLVAAVRGRSAPWLHLPMTA